MCSLKVAIFTGVLLQVKTFVLYPHHNDCEVLPGEVPVDVFQGFVNKVLTFQICLYSHFARVKCVAIVCNWDSCSSK